MKTERLFYQHYLTTRTSLVILEIHGLRSLANCLTNELGIPISFKHLQRITKDLGVRCKRPKLELLHGGEDYEEGKRKCKTTRQTLSSEKKGVVVAFENETIITQKPCIRKSMSFEGEQQGVEHTGSRKKLSAYISMVWPEEKLMTYNFYDKMDSTNTIDHLENLKTNIMKNDWWKRLVLIWDNASYHVSLMVRNYINAQKEDWLTIIHLPKKAPYLNPNERKVNQQIKSDVCANRFYEHMEDQKAAVSEYLDKRFGRWYDDISYDT